MQHLVSIITPLFNSAEYISQTIDSVLQQTYENWELLIIDDNSTDNSLEIVSSYLVEERIKLLKNSTITKGPAICRNIGINNANGKYVIFLDSDDLLSASCISSRVEVFNENSNLDFIVFQMQTFGDNILVNTTKKSDDYLRDFLANQYQWAVSAPIWKLKILLELKGFNNNLLQLEDPELHTRALLRNYKYLVLANNDPDCFYRKIPNKVVNLNNLIYGYKQFIKLNYNEISKRSDLSKYLNSILSCRKSAINSIFKSSQAINIRSGIIIFNQVRSINSLMYNKSHINIFINYLSLLLIILFMIFPFYPPSSIRWLFEKINNKLL